MTFIDLTLARRLELAHAHRSVEYAIAQSRLQQHMKAAFDQIGSAFAVYAGPDSPVNGTRGLGLFGPTTAQELDRVERFFQDHGTSSRMTVCPLAHPSLLQLLGQRDYHIDSFFSVLIMPTDREPSTAPLNPAIAVRELGPQDEELWLRTVATGFAGKAPKESMIDLIRPTFHSASARSFLAWIASEPAGGGTVVLHEGVAELCSASTHPGFRRMGVQTALVDARLRAARAANCDLAMVITTPATPSQRNVERLGFELAYTRAVVTTGQARGSQLSPRPRAQR